MPDSPQTTSNGEPAKKDERCAIRVRGLRKSFDGHEVLRDADLDVERGLINIIIGGSGQGKSVLMKHLMGLLKPDQGHIFVDGEGKPVASAKISGSSWSPGRNFRSAQTKTDAAGRFTLGGLDDASWSIAAS